MILLKALSFFDKFQRSEATIDFSLLICFPISSHLHRLTPYTKRNTLRQQALQDVLAIHEPQNPICVSSNSTVCGSSLGVTKTTIEIGTYCKHLYLVCSTLYVWYIIIATYNIFLFPKWMWSVKTLLAFWLKVAKVWLKSFENLLPEVGRIIDQQVCDSFCMSVSKNRLEHFRVRCQQIR